MSLLARRTYSAQSLVEAFPARLTHRNKREIYAKACPPNAKHNGQIVVSRWDSSLQPNYDGSQSITITATEDSFQYQPCRDENCVEWYVNFADQYLFVAYQGGLMAQDELQVAEHPALASVREVLVHHSRSSGGDKSEIERKAIIDMDEDENGDETELLPLTRVSKGRGTPVLVRGVERRCRFRIDPDASKGRPRGLYGNQFSPASHQAVEMATELIEPPTITNLICMAALGYQRGLYNSTQIADMLSTAAAAFLAAKKESELAWKKKKPSQPGMEEKSPNKSPRTVIHTGKWGCGAFGGNATLMLLIQMIAGRMAGVSHVHFHTFSPDGSEAYQQAMRLLDAHFAADVRQTFRQVVATLEGLRFEWGVSNGT